MYLLQTLEINFAVVGGALLASFLFITMLFLASRYRRCPSNMILAVYGKVGVGRSVRCIHGGGALVWPLIQDYTYLTLTPMTINIPLKNALSMQNIRVNVPSTFTVAIDTTPESMTNAAVRLLNMERQEIETMAQEIIFGQLRLTVASLTIEQINQDRERFMEAVRKNIDMELGKIGLTLINVNITDITDESGYIESIGKKAASTAVNQAKIDVAEQEKKGAIGEADAQRERRIQVASFNAKAVEGENTAKANIATVNADLAEKEADASRRGEVAKQNSMAEIQKAKALAETRRLEAEEVVPREIEKRKVEIDAEAAAEKNRRTARGEADAIVSVKTAEATGIQKVLMSKADGYKALVGSAQNSPKDAATLLLVEKLEDIVRLQTEVIKNIKIDKITVWDSGGEKGSSTANFMSGLVRTLPPLHEVAAMAGVDLPGYLGSIQTPVPPKEELPKPKV
ncbi:MAG: flotillin family protein [Elusimicrobia bacterium]|jgi:flotillin|nr:flotillin family protein [Elusimicrobiota bacterium]